MLFCRSKEHLLFGNMGLFVNQNRLFCFSERPLLGMKTVVFRPFLLHISFINEHKVLSCRHLYLHTLFCFISVICIFISKERTLKAFAKIIL